MALFCSRETAGQVPQASELLDSGANNIKTAQSQKKSRTKTPSEQVQYTAFQHIDHTTLPRLLQQRGFRPPVQFKAFVVVISLTKKRPIYKAYDYFHTSTDKYGDGEKGWWPASTVKLFAAVAALEKLRSLGFSPNAEVTFHYSDNDVTTSVDLLVRQAITPSDNTAFDRLVEIVGLDEINQTFFVPAKGFHSTVLLRAYSARVRDPKSGLGTLRHAPRVTLREGEKVAEIPERVSTTSYPCPDEGNCTTLLELAETMRRVMLHEVIPKDERFDLGEAELELLRSALSGRRERGLGVVKGLKAAFAAAGIKVVTYHKPGFAYNWFSDVVFVQCPGLKKAFIVAMAGYPGRNALDEAAKHVGALLVMWARKRP